MYALIDYACGAHINVLTDLTCEYDGVVVFTACSTDRGWRTVLFRPQLLMTIVMKVIRVDSNTEVSVLIGSMDTR